MFTPLPRPESFFFSSLCTSILFFLVQRDKTIIKDSDGLVSLAYAGLLKKYWCLICYTVKTGQAVALKYTSLNSEWPNLNFDI